MLKFKISRFCTSTANRELCTTKSDRLGVKTRSRLSRFSKWGSENPFLRDFQNVDQETKCFGIFKMSTGSTILRDFQNVDQEPQFCEIFNTSTKNPHFARFSKCRPIPPPILWDFPKVDQEPQFCEIFKMSTKNPHYFLLIPTNSH